MSILNEEAPGQYGADFGGLSVQVDTDRREVRVYACWDGWDEADQAKLMAILSSLGIAGYHDIQDDPGGDVVVLTTHF